MQEFIEMDATVCNFYSHVGHVTKKCSCVLGYQAAYCQLAFAGSTDHDPFSSTIPDAKVYLAQCLHKLSSAHPGKVGGKFITLCENNINVVFQNFLIVYNLFQVSPMIKSSLSPDALACLQKYFEAAGVALS
jgi:hypothetical protein